VKEVSCYRDSRESPRPPSRFIRSLYSLIHPSRNIVGRPRLAHGTLRSPFAFRGAHCIRTSRRSVCRQHAPPHTGQRSGV